MTAAETIERLTALVKEQADIIKEQADALAQLGAVAELDDKIEAAARERAEVLGELRRGARKRPSIFYNAATLAGKEVKRGHTNHESRT